MANVIYKLIVELRKPSLSLDAWSMAVGTWNPECSEAMPQTSFDWDDPHQVTFAVPPQHSPSNEARPHAVPGARTSWPEHAAKPVEMDDPPPVSAP